MALIWISVALKILLGIKSYSALPGRASHLFATALSGALQHTAAWGMWGEVLFSITAGLFVAELMYVGSFAVVNPFERKEIYAFSVSVGGLGLFALMHAAPKAFPDWPRAMYYVHLYSAIIAFFCVIALVLYHFQRGTKPFWFGYCLPAIPWFGVSIWAAWRGTPDWLTEISGVSVQIACLLAWLISMPPLEP